METWRWLGGCGAGAAGSPGGFVGLLGAGGTTQVSTIPRLGLYPMVRSGKIPPGARVAVNKPCSRCANGELIPVGRWHR